MAKKNQQNQLYAIRGFRVRPATEKEVRSTKPIFSLGAPPFNKVGILFLHGLSGSPATFREYGQFFSKKGFNISIPLLPGHCDTLDAFEKVGRKQWVAAALQAYDELAIHCEKVFVMGHSMGGTLALQLAAKNKSIAKLYLLAPFLYTYIIHALVRSYFIPLARLLNIKHWFAVAGDVKDPRRFEITYKKFPLNLGVELEVLAEETRVLLPKIRQDVLIFQGITDHGLNAKMAPQILKQLGSPKKELIWLKNSWHLISMDYQAKEVRDRIYKDMLAQLSIS